MSGGITTCITEAGEVHNFRVCQLLVDEIDFVDFEAIEKLMSPRPFLQVLRHKRELGRFSIFALDRAMMVMMIEGSLTRVVVSHDLVIMRWTSCSCNAKQKAWCCQQTVDLRDEIPEIAVAEGAFGMDEIILHVLNYQS